MGKAISLKEVKEIESAFSEKDGNDFKCIMHGGLCWAGSGRDRLFKNVKYHMQKNLFEFFCVKCEKGFSTLSALYTHLKKHK